MKQSPLGSNKQQRLVFIDALRAFACLSVLVCHLYYRGVFHGTLQRLVPGPLEAILRRADLGVYIFFVISGFVIAYSLRSAAVGPAYVGKFILRRSLRLDPAYWVAMLACILVSAPRLRRVIGVGYPSCQQIIRNMFYLQDLTGTRRILSVSWTLCYECQFYLVIVLCLGAAQWLVGKTGAGESKLMLLVCWPASLLSLACTAGLCHPMTGLFVDLWYSFYIGALVCWVLLGRIGAGWLWGFGIAVLGTLLLRWDWQIIVVILTAATIYAVGRLGRLTHWLNWPILQAVGRMSYSIYLVHSFIAVGVLEFGRRRTGDALLPALGWVLLALSITILSSWALYRLVERPSLAVAKSIKFQQA